MTTGAAQPYDRYYRLFERPMMVLGAAALIIAHIIALLSSTPSVMWTLAALGIMLQFWLYRAIWRQLEHDARARVERRAGLAESPAS
jgi:hypothetical protein